MVTLVLILYFFALVFSVSSQAISGMVSKMRNKKWPKIYFFHFKKTQCKTGFYALNSHLWRPLIKINMFIFILYCFLSSMHCIKCKSVQNRCSLCILKMYHRCCRQNQSSIPWINSMVTLTVIETKTTSSTLPYITMIHNL